MGLVIPQDGDLVALVRSEKERGNALVSKCDYQGALEVYVNCITELAPNSSEDAAEGGVAEIILNSPPEVRDDMTLRLLPSILTNASLCCIKLETYSQAIDYATLALKLSKFSFVKGYFRRGTAHLLLRQFRPAVNDFKKLVAVLPNDTDAKKRLKEAERCLNLERLSAAIAGQKQPKPSEIIPRSGWTIGEDYKGPVYVRGENGKAWPQSRPSADLFDEMIKYLTEDGGMNRLDKRVVMDILLDTIDRLSVLPNVVPIWVGEKDKLVVCGDVHGQFYDLLNIFKTFGRPSETTRYLFNGDFVDRGSFSLEVIMLMYTAALIWPNSIYMTRGNHETKDMTSMYGFSGEVKAKSTSALYDLFLETFNQLPLAHLIGSTSGSGGSGGGSTTTSGSGGSTTTSGGSTTTSGGSTTTSGGGRARVFVVHGGLSSDPAEVTIDMINKLDRLEESSLRTDLLWADPQPQLGSSPSKRGVSKHFGPDITKGFLKANSLDLVVRSHEMMMKGFEPCHDGHLVTVFSAPNYCDQMNNQGAVLVFEKSKLDQAKTPDALYTPHVFSAVTDKPPIPAMHYSQIYRQGGMM